MEITSPLFIDSRRKPPKSFHIKKKKITFFIGGYDKEAAKRKATLEFLSLLGLRCSLIMNT